VKDMTGPAPKTLPSHRCSCSCLSVSALILALTVSGALPVKAAPARTAPPPKGIASFPYPPTIAQCNATAVLDAPCYTPAQIATAYDVRPLWRAGIAGQGKTIVLVDSFGSTTIRHDLHIFDHAFGLPDPPRLEIIQPAGPPPRYDPKDPTQFGWALETSLDVEWAHAIAPRANLLLVELPVALRRAPGPPPPGVTGATGYPQMVAAEQDVLAHQRGDVISQSFGTTEQAFPSAATLRGLRAAYITAAADHVSVLAASGDSGASGLTLVGSLYPSRVVGWPASDPLVTAVGGTQLHLTVAGTRAAPDTVWNDQAVIHEPIASGGGQSVIFNRPAWQDAVRAVVGAQRGIPDLSLTAGGAIGYLSVGIGPLKPGYYVVSGTSWSTPLFAGVVALADQEAGHDLGVLNPTLYQLAARHAPGLVDITAGANTVGVTIRGKTVTVPGYDAVVGYDLASGLGTIDVAKLVPELAGRAAS